MISQNCMGLTCRKELVFRAITWDGMSSICTPSHFCIGKNNSLCITGITYSHFHHRGSNLRWCDCSRNVDGSVAKFHDVSIQRNPLGRIIGGSFRPNFNNSYVLFKIWGGVAGLCGRVYNISDRSSQIDKIVELASTQRNSTCVSDFNGTSESNSEALFSLFKWFLGRRVENGESGVGRILACYVAGCDNIARGGTTRIANVKPQCPCTTWIEMR